MKTDRIYASLLLRGARPVGLPSCRIARAQNQQEMNRQAEQDFNTADAEMTKVYKELVGNMSKTDLEELKVAQRAWLQFRDAQAKYEADLAARGGTLYPTIYNGRRAAMTKARTAQLKEVLDHG